MPLGKFLFRATLRRFPAAQAVYGVAIGGALIFFGVYSHTHRSAEDTSITQPIAFVAIGATFAFTGILALVAHVLPGDDGASQERLE
jgi:hypothetical protein